MTVLVTRSLEVTSSLTDSYSVPTPFIYYPTTVPDSGCLFPTHVSLPESRTPRRTGESRADEVWEEIVAEGGGKGREELGRVPPRTTGTREPGVDGVTGGQCRRQRRYPVVCPIPTDHHVFFGRLSPWGCACPVSAPKVVRVTYF